MSAARLAQLYALRAQVDALIVAEEAELGMARPVAAVDPEQCPACGAPAEAQRNTSTLDGIQRRFCTKCRTERTL